MCRHVTKARRTSAAGFTLLEIMIVVAVMGLLSAVAVPSFMSARETSRQNRVRKDLQTIAGAVELLIWDTAQYPGGLVPDQVDDREILDLNLPIAGLMTNAGLFSKDWNGPYVKKIPIDPWGQNYFFDPDYRVNGTMFPVVGSFGPNARGVNEYDEDDIVVILTD